MRAVYDTVIFIFVVLFVGSCVNDPYEDSSTSNEEFFVLRLSNTGLVTRATAAGEDKFNENKIQTIDCFFYPNGRTNENAVFSAVNLNVSANGTTDIRLKLPIEKKNALFGNSSTCQVYVIANRPEGTAIGSQTDMMALKGLSIVADGFTTNADGGVQKSFVMDGSAIVTLATNGKSAFGNVSLYRAASKIQLNVSVKDRIQDEAGATWFPQLDQMHIMINNVVRKATIDVSTVPYKTNEADYFSIDHEGEARKLTPVSEGASDIYDHIPFYSYSSSWNESLGSRSPMIRLVIPWKKEGESLSRKCYYKIPVNEHGLKLDRNTFYKIRLSVGMLGSFSPENSIELNPSYIILNWGTGEVNAEMLDLRYLTVGFSKTIMENRNSVNIPYASSHACELVNVTVTRPNLTTEISTTETLISNQTNANGIYYDNKDNSRPYTFSLSNNSITFTHNLKNRSGDDDKSNFDYTPYHITFTIRHRDQRNYSEQISITQYPMMYIEASLNSDYKGQNRSNNANRGFMMVNNGTTFHNSYDYSSKYNLGNTKGLEGGNKNPNMYVITTTALQGVTSYTIGDPRSNTIDNLSIQRYYAGYYYNYAGIYTDDNWSVQATSLYGGYRKLRYYYPAENNARTRNMIAPKFRIASSYGVTSAIVRGNAEARCASYQEDGFPAGRWRVPTAAEVRYIIDLSEQKKIPRLFGYEPSLNRVSTYWTANGLITITGRNVTTNDYPSDETEAHVRCVYDEWYWGNKAIENKQEFTWGDRPR